MPSAGNASPVLLGDLVCVTAEPTTILCADAADGHIVWQHSVTFLDTVNQSKVAEVRTAIEEAAALADSIKSDQVELDRLRRVSRRRDAPAGVEARIQELMTGLSASRARLKVARHLRPPEEIPFLGSASSTPVTDGEALYAVFGNEIVASFSVEGTLRWARHLPHDTVQMLGYDRGQAASPLMDGTTLIVALGGLYGLDANTGAVRWRVNGYRSFGTPALGRVGDTTFVATPEGQIIRTSDGAILKDGLGTIVYLGPIVTGTSVIFAGTRDGYGGDDSPAGMTGYALAPAPRGAIDVSQTFRVDVTPGRIFASPIALRGLALLLGNDYLLRGVDTSTGAISKAHKLPLERGTIYSSLTGAGRYLYASADDGHTLVLSDAPPWNVIGNNRLEPFASTPVFDGDRMYIRGQEHLYCIVQR